MLAFIGQITDSKSSVSMLQLYKTVGVLCIGLVVTLQEERGSKWESAEESHQDISCTVVTRRAAEFVLTGMQEAKE